MPPTTSRQRALDSPPKPKQAKKPYTKTSKSEAKESKSRAKTGCLTCRLRRKKCDESKDEDGSCVTCARLHLECLGFVSKRPEWMRNKNKLEEAKRDIRHFLADHDLIKGVGKSKTHTEPSPSSSANIPARLSFAKYYDTTQAPTSHRTRTRPVPTYTDDEDEDEDQIVDDCEDHAARSQTLCSPPEPVLSPATPRSATPVVDFLPDDAILPSYTLVPSQSLPDVDTQQLCPPFVLSHHVALYDPNSRGFTSIVGYSLPPGQAEEDVQYDELPFDTTLMSQAYQAHPPPAMIVEEPLDTPIYIDPAFQEVMHNFMYWIDHVLPFQYSLSTYKEMPHLLNEVLFTNQSAVNSMCGLAYLHRIHNNSAMIAESSDPNEAIKSVGLMQRQTKDMLLDQSQQGNYRDAGYALAAIFGISYVLFEGGVGDWNSYLDVACEWFKTQSEGIYRGAATISPAIAFIAASTIWFDVIGSVTLRKPPKLMNLYRALIQHEGRYGISLSQVMGCDNVTMLAIGEIAVLLDWKETQVAMGCLDVVQLAERGRVIDSTLSPSVRPRQSFADAFIETPIDEYLSPSIKAHKKAQGVTAVFRAAARVYLATVVSGPSPNVPSVAGAVDDAFDVLQSVPHSDYDRSMVFSLCIIGCMARTEVQREIMRQRMARTQSKVGNCRKVTELVNEVWRLRDQADIRKHISWSDVMVRDGWNILLA